MTHRRRRLVRAGALAWLVLAAGLLLVPVSASPTADDPAPTQTVFDPPSASNTSIPPSGTASPSPPSEPSPTGLPETSETAAASTDTPTAAVTETPGETASATDTPPEATTISTTGVVTGEPSSTAETPSPTPAWTEPTIEESPTASATATSSLTPTSTPEALGSPGTAPSFAAGAVLINEVAWAGTLASTSDEWIELWNPGPDPIDLDGWVVSDGDDIHVVLAGEIAEFGFYLLERTDDQTISDLAADRIYAGSLNNGGETLELLDPSAGLIDTANAAGGAWPAGNTSARASMERHGALDLAANWSTFPGDGGNGLDAEGHPIAGTPRRPNAPSGPAPSPSPTPTPTPSATLPGPAATPAPAEAVIINEVGWAGTHASSSDEWIELLNPGSAEIDLSGWALTDDGDMDVALGGILSAGGYFLLERSDDGTISDIPADGVYTGALSNDGETLRLVDPTGAEIDLVNPTGGPWPAGRASDRASMERLNGAWQTFNGFNALGLDADGQRVRGTPRGPNSGLFPTPQPTGIVARVVINEVLVRPRHDWEGAGGVTTDDEFIELYNRGPGSVNLAGWQLDDYAVGGSPAYELPSITLAAGEFAALFRSRTHIALNDGGDSIRLSDPDGALVDKLRYRRVQAYNLSVGRWPDGDDDLTYGLWPTPGKKNAAYVPPSFPPGSILINEIAWAGTGASANDEWIELWNPGTEPIHLDGWVLTDDGDLQIELSGILGAGSFLTLERTDDQAVSDLAAGLLYAGALSNDGERLWLRDPSGGEVDLVDASGGWPAGDDERRASMERLDDGWETYTGQGGRGRDALGQPIQGTPGVINSAVAAAELAAALACDFGPRSAGRACP